jgi:threonine/homoserine/homoserine lactone efflux protein
VARASVRAGFAAVRWLVALFGVVGMGAVFLKVAVQINQCVAYLYCFCIDLAAYTARMSSQELSALLVLATAMSFTPGPNTMLSTTLAAQWGLRRTWAFLFAVPVGWTLLMLACALGLGTLLTTLPVLRSVVRWVGVTVLLWLAWKLWRARPQTGRDQITSNLHVGFVQGVLLQFVNIKAWTLALALTAGWVTPTSAAAAEQFSQRLVLVLMVMALFAFFSNLTYALIGASLRSWLQQGQRLLGFNRGMALLLAATALWMGWTS